MGQFFIVACLTRMSLGSAGAIILSIGSNSGSAIDLDDNSAIVSEYSVCVCFCSHQQSMLKASCCRIIRGWCCDDGAVLRSEREDISASGIEEKIDKRSPPSVM